jgi:uncharacterized protein YjdB
MRYVFNPFSQTIIPISESGDSGGVIEPLTYAQYIALETKNPTTLYVVNDEDNQGGTIALTAIALNTHTLTVGVGTTQTLTVAFTPANAGNKNVSWSSSSNAIATVANGVVTGVASGSTTITVTSEDGGFTDTCTVTVQESTISVTGVTLNKSSTSIVAGSAEQLTATVAPSNASNKSVTWASSNTNYATVTSNGLVQGVAAGSATITVTTVDGSFTAQCTVTVTASVVKTFWAGTKTNWGITVDIESNHVTINGTKQTGKSPTQYGSPYYTADVDLFSAPSAWTTFTAGTVLDLVVKNCTYTALPNGGINSFCFLRKNDNTVLMGNTYASPTGTYQYIVPGGGITVYGIGGYINVGYTFTNVEFDVEFSVNGVRWI